MWNMKKCSNKKWRAEKRRREKPEETENRERENWGIMKEGEIMNNERKEKKQKCETDKWKYENNAKCTIHVNQ